ncbi:MAG TPA: hypothetical protein VEC08_01005 [Nitrososphaerales archaeon]|nr:hypothetical protein [Nitrososphaerales archaeon]
MVGKQALDDERMVDTEPPKELAAGTLCANPIPKRVLEAEPNIVSATGFVAKLGIWLAILARDNPP